MIDPTPEQIEAAARAMSEASSGFFSEGSWRHLAREALAAAAGTSVSGSMSDGHHTFDELYDYRMLYNAHAAHGWLVAGIPVVKSWKHSDGELCFGGGWFIVTATLPTGQVSNHYKAEHWGLFAVPEVDLPPDYDGHTPQVAAERLRAAAGAAPQEPTYSPHTRSWSGTCPCILSEQVDPECEWHGRPEFRPGGELHSSAPSNHMVTKAARVLHIASCCKLDEGAEHQEPQNEDLFAAGVVLSAVPLAPMQVDEAKLAEVLVRALTYGTGLDAETNNAIAATQASDAAEYLRGGGQ